MHLFLFLSYTTNEERIPRNVFTAVTPSTRGLSTLNMNQDRCHNWTAYYVDLKNKVAQTRKSGMITSSAQKLGYEEEIKQLQRTLRTMQESPMEYEMCVRVYT